MPPDVSENYDPPVGDFPGVHAEVLRSRGRAPEPFPEPSAANQASPVPFSEPGIGTVVAFKVQHQGGGKTYDYAAIRAGDGKWYTTGASALQATDWATFARAVRERISGPFMVMRPDRHFYL